MFVENKNNHYKTTPEGLNICRKKNQPKQDNQRGIERLLRI